MYSVKLEFGIVLSIIIYGQRILFRLQYTESKESFGYEGAYVKDPVVGFHDWIASFDLNSLYPHLIMQYNISPETMVGFEPNRVNVENMLNQKSDLSDLENRTITPNGAQFRTDKRGFLPELMETLYIKNELSIKRKC